MPTKQKKTVYKIERSCLTSGTVEESQQEAQERRQAACMQQSRAVATADWQPHCHLSLSMMSRDWPASQSASCSPTHLAVVMCPWVASRNKCNFILSLEGSNTSGCCWLSRGDRLLGQTSRGLQKAQCLTRNHTMMKCTCVQRRALSSFFYFNGHNEPLVQNTGHPFWPVHTGWDSVKLNTRR